MKKIVLVLLILLSFRSFSQIPTNGLIGYWPFNGNANDVSGNGNNGQVNGATLTNDRFGNSNSAYFFPGNVANKIVVADNSSFTFNNEFTISAWAYFLQPWTFHVEDIVYKGSFPFNSGWSLSVNQDNSTYGPGNYSVLGSMTIGSGATGVSQYIQPYTFFNNWHHYAYSYDGTFNRLYIDGVLVDSVAITNPILNNNLNVEIGGSLHPVSGAYDRNIDDVAIYNRSLNTVEINQLFTGNSIISCQGSTLPLNLTNGLAAWYPFCGNANDESGNGNNGIVNGATSSNDRFNNSASAYNFNGTSDNITVNSSPSLVIDSNISISLWMKTTTMTRSSLLEKGQVFSYWNYGLGIDNGRIGYTYSNYSVGPQTLVNDGNWHHIVCVINESANTMIFYIDGIADTNFLNFTGNVNYNGPYSNFIDPRPNANLFIGENGGTGAEFPGDIDDIGIWNRSLDSTEVSQLYNNGLTAINTTNLNTISIYPNPATDHLTIEFGNTVSNKSHLIKLTDLHGQTIYSAETFESVYTLDLTTLKNKGICFLSISDKQGKIESVKKILIF